MKQRYSIIHCDEFIVVVGKPAGLLSIPDRYDRTAPSMVELLSRRFEDIFVIHRLDRETSGVMVFGRDAQTHRHLSGQFESGGVEKTYYALVQGTPEWSSHRSDLPLLVDADRAHRTRVDHRRGKPAVTAFEVIEQLGSFCLIKAVPATGRTHQVRVHLAAMGLPIVGDSLYGSGEGLYLSAVKRKYRPGRREERPLVGRTALHALSLRFHHPGTNGPVRYERELFGDMRAALNQLRKHGAGRTAGDVSH